MLAERKFPSSETLERLLPLIALPKLDAIRGLVVRGRLRSRKLEPIPNRYVSERFSSAHYEGLDGELVYGDPTAPDVYRVTQSILSERDDERGRDVLFHAFDLWNTKDPFSKRLDALRGRVGGAGVALVEHRFVGCLNELTEYENEVLALGYEGLILRSPGGLYKFGRSTMKEGGMLKLKRFDDAEAEVLGFVEEMKNNNPKTRDKLGNAKRSSHKENKVGKGMLGKLICRNEKLFPGVTFDVPCGAMPHAVRKLLWKTRTQLVGRTVKFKYFPIGGKERPRHPVFLGWRDEWDQ